MPQDTSQGKTIYEAFFGDYIGKRISISDEGYYIGSDWVSGRYYSGILNRVVFNERGLALDIEHNLITVFPKTKIKIQYVNNKR